MDIMAIHSVNTSRVYPQFSWKLCKMSVRYIAIYLPLLYYNKLCFDEHQNDLNIIFSHVHQFLTFPDWQYFFLAPY